MLNGQATQGYQYPSWNDGKFLQSDDIRCNKGSENHAKNTKAASVIAGQDVVGFTTNIHTKIYHPGPLTILMSKAPGDVSDYDGSGDWFKVYQLGYKSDWNGSDSGWNSYGKNKFTFKLPAEIPQGQYLMRIEHMATHPPYKAKQFFLQCAHLDVKSDYTGSAPDSTIKLPGGYTMDSPAIQFDSWADPRPTCMTMPSPDKMWPNDNNFNKMLDNGVI
ncbi:cellulose-growth-specific protein [Colletotrichum spaethianum]|uniref:lytic cellulose monooxygenase (C4-dehydrogenating) n=1 Tax=Colletotrichum spaethianum TaxID=700344 RepID=A0AA37UL98_9PEZI|nr:cellulose-growth-specific protein [Colletotrichum spaethianum]GKT51361.1 cellulose-growth-specific protein [Colletotrichum spaethianum]